VDGCFSTPHSLAGLPLSLVQELEAQMYLCFSHGVKLWFLGRHWCKKGDLVGSWQKWPVAREVRCRNGRRAIPRTLQIRETPRFLSIHRSHVRKKLLGEPRHGKHVKVNLGVKAQGMVWSCLKGPVGFGVPTDCHEKDAYTGAHLGWYFGERAVKEPAQMKGL
jgi:hypothetical protein